MVSFSIWSVSIPYYDNETLITCNDSLYTCAVYIGASIYVASEEGVMEQFGVGITTAELGLALYALACNHPAERCLRDILTLADGFGPVVFGPLSE